MIRSLAICFCLLFVANRSIGQRLGFSLPEGKKKVEVPFQLVSNLIVVPLIINKKLPLKFILDTGVRTAILTEKVYSDILDLAYSRKYTISGPGGEQLAEAYITNNVSLDLLEIKGKGHSMLVLEEDYLQLRSTLGIDVHGILGYELFSRFVVFINYAAKKLVIYDPQKFKPRKSYNMLPIVVEETKPYFNTSVTVNDSTTLTAKLLIDTGASHELMLEPESDSRITVPTKNISSLLGRGLGGEISGRIARVTKLEMGPYTLFKMLSSFPDPESYGQVREREGYETRMGTLGGGILSRFNVIIDYPHDKIYFKKNRNFKTKSYHNLSGLTIISTGDELDQYIVTNVRKDSPAYNAGIRENDEIININGVSNKDFTLRETQGSLNQRPGKKIFMQLNRNGQIIKARFQLKTDI